jgi:hypothetical protein
MRFREFSDLSDHAGQVPSAGTRAVRRYVSIGREPVPPHDVEPVGVMTIFDGVFLRKRR